MKRPTDRSRLETLREFNRKLLRLCGLATEIAKLGDERATLRTIVDTAASLIGVDGAHLALVDRGERTLYGVASSGRRLRGARTLRVDLSRSAAAQEALRERRPVSIASARGDARVNRLARKVLSIGSITYLPLLSGAQSFGLLILISRQPRAWSKMDLDLARHFASFASVALENLRLLNRLAETEGRFRSLVEHIPAIVYICDVEPPYATIYVSPQTETMLGYASKEWLDDPGFFMKIIHPEDVKAVVDHDAAAVKSSGFATTEYRLVDRWGAIRWVRDESVLVRDPAGEPIGWHGVLVEITGIKRAEPPSAAGPIGVGRAARRSPSPESQA